MGVGCSGLEDDSVLANSVSAVTGPDDYLEFGDMIGSDEEDSEALARAEEEWGSDEEEPEEPAPVLEEEEDIDSDEEEPEEPACKPFEPTSPPPKLVGHLPTPPQGACDFYQKVVSNPGGCSQEKRTLLGGYHQTCSNVSSGVSSAPSGANCKYQTAFRDYVDTFRYCLQEEVTELSTTDGCLTPGTTCTDVVDNIRDAHSVCNDQTDFCSTMENADAGYCFGYSIGEAWGALGVGTLPGGPTSPLGVMGTLDSICVCDDSLKVQRNICAGYRQGCADANSGNPTAATLCAASCPDPAFAPASVLCP